MVGFPRRRRARRADGRREGVLEDVGFGIRRPADLRRQLLRRAHPRDHRNAGGQHGQLRARQPACAAHDLPLRLCRTTLEGAVLGTRSYGPALLRRARRILRRRGQRTDLGLVRVLGPRVLSRLSRIGRICGGFAALQKSAHPPRKRRDRGNRSSRERPREPLCRKDDTRRKDSRTNFPEIRRAAERSEDRFRDAAGTERQPRREIRRRSLFDER